MTLKNRLFVAALSLASLGLGTLPLLGGVGLTPTFGDQTTARMSAGVESSLFVESSTKADPSI